MLPRRADERVINVHADHTFRVEVLCFNDIDISCDCTTVVKSPTYFAGHQPFIAANVEDTCTGK